MQRALDILPPPVTRSTSATHRSGASDSTPINTDTEAKRAHQIPLDADAKETVGPILIVVSQVKDWPFEIPGVEVVAARSYLADRRYSDQRGAKIFNLCRSYRYQTIGYYVS